MKISNLNIISKQIQKSIRFRFEELSENVLFENNLNKSNSNKLNKIIKGALSAKTKKRISDLDPDLLSVMGYGGNYVTQRLKILNKSCVPSLKIIHDELKKLKSQNDSLYVDSNNLYVVTKGIVLHGIRFGRFKIGLRISELGSLNSYETVNAIALEPNRSLLNFNVTHPHINGDKLCVGDAKRSIMAAKQEFRIQDYFDIITIVLGNYGITSPYCYIESWFGDKCRDCGEYHSNHSESKKKTVLCDKCKENGCDECVSSCCNESNKNICGSCSRDDDNKLRCHSCYFWGCKSCISVVCRCGSYPC